MENLPIRPKIDGDKSTNLHTTPSQSAQPSHELNDKAQKLGTSSRSEPVSSASLPDFIVRRNELFEELKKHYDSREKSHSEIQVVLDLGPSRPPVQHVGESWRSTPGSFLRYVSKEVSADVVVAKVDGVLWDLDRPLESSCRISYVPFTSPEGRNVFWHSSAHVLGEAAECHYNCLLSHGPPVEQGFFYDMRIADK